MTETYISNVLIVDDIKANLISLRALIESEDVNVIEASSGNEALKALLYNRIDLILLDVQMPDMNGFEVAEIMRSNKKTASIPIIFITAINKDEHYIFKGYELGAVDYIYKPVTNEILKSKVRVFIRLNKQTRIIEDRTKRLEEKIRELEAAEEKIMRLANMDALTGIHNRRVFNERYEIEWNGCMRNSRKLSVILMDIDFFKDYNDTYGHLVGDECLTMISKELEKTIERPYDLVARYGGEEFVVLLPETDRDGAVHVAEAIRRNIEDMKIQHKTSEVSDYVTVSLGIASVVPKEDMQSLDLIKLADDALYEAKNSGRNRVVASVSEYEEELI